VTALPRVSGEQDAAPAGPHRPGVRPQLESRQRLAPSPLDRHPGRGQAQSEAATGVAATQNKRAADPGLPQGWQSRIARRVLRRHG